MVVLNHWKINIDGMSSVGRSVLRAYVLFGANVSEILVDKLRESISKDNEVMREVIEEELMNRGSLLYAQYEDDGLRMHPLVREFVVQDARRDVDNFGEVLTRAICVMHDSIEALLNQNGLCMDMLRERWNTDLSCLSLNQFSLLKFMDDTFCLSSNASSILKFVTVSSVSGLVYEVIEKLIRVFQFAINSDILSPDEHLTEQFYQLVNNIHNERGHDLFAACVWHEQAFIYFRKDMHGRAKNKTVEQEALLRRSSSEDQKHRLRLASSLNLHGLILLGKGDLQEAELVFRESLAIQHGQHSENADALLAYTLFNLASVLQLSGSYKQAESKYREEFEKRRCLCGENYSSKEEVHAYFKLAID